MLEDLKTKYSYDDLLIIPEFSALSSRAVVDAVSPRKLGNIFGHGFPIISAAMDTVTEMDMMEAMSSNMALGIHHRYNVRWHTLRKATKLGGIAVSPSMVKEVPQFFRNLPKSLLVIDVAHGDSQRCYDAARMLKDLNHIVVSGNIATVRAADNYMALGIDILRVGIGPGSACSTRVVSGVGYPQASAINEIHKEFPEATIIADGGIKSSGDIVKALALGADYVILGNLLAGTRETPGKVYYDDPGQGMIHLSENQLNEMDNTGHFHGYKVYRGMASRESLKEAGKTIRPEGVSGTVPYKGPVVNVVDELIEGIKAGCAYVGARNIRELRMKAQFVRVTNAGYKEGLPRI
jgi:IMP dehydrogenase